MKAIDELWVGVHGPMKELITDCEGGIVLSDKTTQYLARKGIKLCPRGKDQHARYVERRGALLRDTIHRIEGQLQEEGIAGIPFESILAEATFCGNAMLTVGGSTPYNALYGRVPKMLPSIDQIESPGEANKPNPGLIAHTHRLREISIQAMVEGSARARLGRALNTRTTISAQRLNLQVGDEVDIYRAPTNKDTSGWEGPAEVIDISRAARGVVSVKHNSRVREVQLAHVRRHLHFWSLLDSEGRPSGSQQTEARSFAYPTTYDNVWSYIRAGAELCRQGSFTHVGCYEHNGEWLITSATRKDPKLMSAVKFFGENHLHLSNIIAARIGRGLKELPPNKGVL